LTTCKISCIVCTWKTKWRSWRSTSSRVWFWSRWRTDWRMAKSVWLLARPKAKQWRTWQPRRQNRLTSLRLQNAAIAEQPSETTEAWWSRS